MTGGNIQDQNSFVAINRARWKNAMIGHFRDHALTLAWNCSRSLDIAEGNLKTLHAIVDRQLLGRNFNCRCKTERTMAVFVFEGVSPGGHLHVHSLWRVTDPRRQLKFAKLVRGMKDKLTGKMIRPAAWNRIVKSGSHKLDLMTDWSTFAGYALKDQQMLSDPREIVWSDQFYPK